MYKLGGHCPNLLTNYFPVENNQVNRVAAATAALDQPDPLSFPRHTKNNHTILKVVGSYV